MPKADWIRDEQEPGRLRIEKTRPQKGEIFATIEYGTEKVFEFFQHLKYSTENVFEFFFKHGLMLVQKLCRKVQKYLKKLEKNKKKYTYN
jgi:hypothetical protein